MPIDRARCAQIILDEFRRWNHRAASPNDGAEVFAQAAADKVEDAVLDGLMEPSDEAWDAGDKARELAAPVSIPLAVHQAMLTAERERLQRERDDG
jgi:hypothetical protein